MPIMRCWRKGTKTRPPIAGTASSGIRYVNAMSRGTGRATSQNSDIYWTDKLRRPVSTARCPLLRSGSRYGPFGYAQGKLRPSLQALIREFQSEVLHHHLQILSGFAFLARIAQEECRMVRHGQLRSLPRRIAAACAGWHEVIETATQFGHGRINRQEVLRSHGA